MDRIPIRKPSPTETPNGDQAVAAFRIRFVAEAQPGAKVRRLFKQPRIAVAVEETISPADLPVGKPWPDPTDQLFVVFVPKGAAKEAFPDAEAWMASPDQSEAAPPTTVERDGELVKWRPGRVLVQGSPEGREDILAALVDFAFYEGELRQLEESLEAREAQAKTDVARAYRILYRDRRHWQTFTEMIEYFSKIRLAYARLEPRLTKGSRSLRSSGRRLMSRLLARADVKDRLESLNDRLETVEGLYEGANDRVSDYRWYRNGHMLELLIVVFLVVECAIMGTELGFRYLEYRAEKLAEPDEFRATITKVANDRITFTKITRGASGKVYTEQSLPVLANAIVARGKLDRTTGEVDYEAAENLEGGLSNEAFTTIPANGLRAHIITDNTNSQIAELYILQSSKKGR